MNSERFFSISKKKSERHRIPENIVAHALFPLKKYERQRRIRFTISLLEVNVLSVTSYIKSGCALLQSQFFLKNLTPKYYSARL